jgi:hypothetical protein
VDDRSSAAAIDEANVPSIAATADSATLGCVPAVFAYAIELITAAMPRTMNTSMTGG